MYEGNELTVELDFEIEMNSDVIDVENTIDQEVVSERLSFEIRLSDVDVEIMTTLAVDEDRLRNITVADFLRFDPISQMLDIRQ